MIPLFINLMIIAITLSILAAMSRRANVRFATEDRLPMQWGLDGSVNWTAPRPLALALVPLLAGVSLALTLVLPPRPGQEALVVPVTMGLAAVFIAIHALHIYMIGRTLNRQRP